MIRIHGRLKAWLQKTSGQRSTYAEISRVATRRHKVGVAATESSGSPTEETEHLGELLGTSASMLDMDIYSGHTEMDRSRKT